MKNKKALSEKSKLLSKFDDAENVKQVLKILFALKEEISYLFYQQQKKALDDRFFDLKNIKVRYLDKPVVYTNFGKLLGFLNYATGTHRFIINEEDKTSNLFLKIYGLEFGATADDFAGTNLADTLANFRKIPSYLFNDDYFNDNEEIKKYCEFRTGNLNEKIEITRIVPLFDRINLKCVVLQQNRIWFTKETLIEKLDEIINDFQIYLKERVWDE